MVTDNKRREVAQELRELRHTTYYSEEVVENICDAISIADTANTFREPEDVYKLLADLIEPECKTCSMEYVPEWSNDELYPTECYRCSECGHVVNEGKPSYCPNCGAEVTDD